MRTTARYRFIENPDLRQCFVKFLGLEMSEICRAILNAALYIWGERIIWFVLPLRGIRPPDSTVRKEGGHIPCRNLRNFAPAAGTNQL